MAEKIVEVIQSGTSLLLDPPWPVELIDGDLVWWKFPENLPSGQFGFVFFHARLGPFHSLRSFTNTVVLGKGNVGGDGGPADGAYSYTAMILQPGEKEPIAIGPGTILNRATQVDTAPEVSVTYDPQEPDPTKSLTVIPKRLGLNPGDTATWYITNLPEGAFANFCFDCEPTGLPAPTGPFQAFYACRGDDLVSVRASGTGFATGVTVAVGEEIPYHLEVRNENGVLIGSHDPAIDNLGPPPPGDAL